jgi:hypothetical protein
MPAPSWLLRAVRAANAVLFLCGVGLVFNHSVAIALTRMTEPPHWSKAAGPVVVVDYTADPAWHGANQHAVAVWNQAAAGTGLQLMWVAGTGPCAPGRDRIVVCGTTEVALDDGEPLSRQGVANVELGNDLTQAHVGEALLWVCQDCLVDATRRRVVATHELGHALGLAHSPRPASVMFHTGGPDRPDEGDAVELRALYAHVDGPDSCGYFDARLGGLCF